MRTAKSILAPHIGMKEDTMKIKIDDLCITPREALRAMHEWAKQVAEALFHEMNTMFDKRSKDLLEGLQPHVKQSFTFKLHGEVPAATEVIDKWYEQYINKINTKAPE